MKYAGGQPERRASREMGMKEKYEDKTNFNEGHYLRCGESFELKPFARENNDKPFVEKYVL